MEPFGEEPANFGSIEVTERNQSVSSSTALAKALNSQTPLRYVIIVLSFREKKTLKMVKESRKISCMYV